MSGAGISFVDRARAGRLLAEAGLDALVIAEPEPFRWASGVSQGVAGLFRRAGAGFALLPADPALPIGIVVGDLGIEAARRIVPDVRSHPLWIEHATLPSVTEEGAIGPRLAATWQQAGRPSGFTRPATFDLHCALRALEDLLVDRGLTRGRIGFDLDYIAASAAETIRAAWPNRRILNGSPALDRLRMVKTPPEIERLVLALALSEAGLHKMAAGAREGQEAGDLHELFRQGIVDEAERRSVPAPPSWDYIGIGTDPWGSGGRIAASTVVKADVGCVVDGYSSDTSRNYVFGAPTREQADLHRIIEEAFEAGVAAIRPGAPMKAAHRAATAALEAAGLAGFSRGHFGHGLGNSLFSEQWPFIAANEETPFEAGMVMSFEVPIYVMGLGGFNLEDQFIVEPAGPRFLTTLPRKLLPLG